MIRFVDLRGQDTGGGRFAFYDTITDRFVEDDYGAVTWNTWGEFCEMPRAHVLAELSRFEALAPDWTEKAADEYENLTVEEGAPCIVCKLCQPARAHTSLCMSRAELVSWLMGEP